MSIRSFSASSASGQGAAIPSTWAHLRGPLHQLLEFQQFRCAVCREPFTWTFGMEPRQWVRDDLLWALVCYGCSRRYTSGVSAEVSDVIARSLRAIVASPPGQECEATRGLGRQKRPRPLNATVASTEVPTPQWRYYNTVAHSLLLWQRGRCAICSTGLRVTSAPRTVHVDHDPATRFIRGLLCQRCNIALGKEELGQLPQGWWAHHEPFMEHYLAHPPAKYLPATRGRTYAGRMKAARIVLSADGAEVLYDGLARSILEQGVAANHWRPVDPDEGDGDEAVDGFPVWTVDG